EFPWPDRVRARAEALAVEVPANAAPRSIGLEPVATEASLERANALGLRRTGLGVVMPDECDAFGRMRTEGLMRRLSDAPGGRPNGGGGHARGGGAAGGNPPDPYPRAARG